MFNCDENLPKMKFSSEKILKLILFTKRYVQNFDFLKNVCKRMRTHIDMWKEVRENHTHILTFYLITEVTPRNFHSIINKTDRKTFIDMIYDTTAKSIFHRTNVQTRMQ